jgi:hypothetical protein
MIFCLPLAMGRGDSRKRLARDATERFGDIDEIATLQVYSNGKVAVWRGMTAPTCWPSAAICMS